MNAPAPQLLREDDAVCFGQGSDRQVGVQVDPAMPVSLVDQLAAVEGILAVRVEEIEIIRFSQLG